MYIPQLGLQIITPSPPPARVYISKYTTSLCLASDKPKRSRRYTHFHLLFFFFPRKHKPTRMAPRTHPRARVSTSTVINKHSRRVRTARVTHTYTLADNSRFPNPCSTRPAAAAAPAIPKRLSRSYPPRLLHPIYILHLRPDNPASLEREKAKAVVAECVPRVAFNYSRALHSRARVYIGEREREARARRVVQRRRKKGEREEVTTLREV